MLEHRTGDLWDAGCDAVVIPVNCVGTWGGGLALQAKRRFPDIARQHCEDCRRGLIRPGEIWIGSTGAENAIRFLLCVPTKRHWRDDSRLDDVIAGIKALRETLERKVAVKTVALPALGAGLGNLDPNDVLKEVENHLEGLDAVQILCFGLKP